MTVQAATTRPIGTMHVGLLGIVLVAAAAFSAGIGLGASNWLVPTSGTQPIAEPAPAFNAPGFRIGEKLPLSQAAPAFDAPAFRIGEKGPLAQPVPAFDAPGFRLQEKSS
jgi:hypothetical protein